MPRAGSRAQVAAGARGRAGAGAQGDAAMGWAQQSQGSTKGTIPDRAGAAAQHSPRLPVAEAGAAP